MDSERLRDFADWYVKSAVSGDDEIMALDDHGVTVGRWPDDGWYQARGVVSLGLAALATKSPIGWANVNRLFDRLAGDFLARDLAHVSSYELCFVGWAAVVICAGGHSSDGEELADVVDEELVRRLTRTPHGWTVREQSGSEDSPCRLDTLLHCVEYSLTRRRVSGSRERSELLEVAGETLLGLVGHGALSKGGIPLNLRRSTADIARWNASASTPFEPHGVSLGHHVEWARVCCQLLSVMPRAGSLDALQNAVSWMVDVVTDCDGPLFFTVDVNGSPLDTRRYHWVTAEAACAFAALAEHCRSSKSNYDLIARRLWATYLEEFWPEAMIAPWCQVEPGGAPVIPSWAGRSDAFHTVSTFLSWSMPSATCSLDAALRGNDPGWGASVQLEW